MSEVAGEGEGPSPQGEVRVFLKRFWDAGEEEWGPWTFVPRQALYYLSSPQKGVEGA